MKKNDETLAIRKDSYIRFDKDTGHYTLTNKSVFHDVIIISVPAFLKLENELNAIFGAAGENILQIIGEAAGGESAKRLAHVENTEEDVRTVFNSVSKWGFGKYELVELDPDGYVKFKLHNNPLFISQDKPNLGLTAQTKINNHNFLIGFYNGYFSMIFNGTTLCKETKCMNNGDEFCEFEIKKLT